MGRLGKGCLKVTLHCVTWALRCPSKVGHTVWSNNPQRSYSPLIWLLFPPGFLHRKIHFAQDLRLLTPPWRIFGEVALSKHSFFAWGSCNSNAQTLSACWLKKGPSKVPLLHEWSMGGEAGRRELSPTTVARGCAGVWGAAGAMVPAGGAVSRMVIIIQDEPPSRLWSLRFFTFLPPRCPEHTPGWCDGHNHFQKNTYAFPIEREYWGMPCPKEKKYPHFLSYKN